MYISLKTPLSCARFELRTPPPPRLRTWRDIPQKIRLRARVGRSARRLYRKLRVWLGLDWPLGVELAAEALHYKFTIAAQRDLSPKGGAK